MLPLLAQRNVFLSAAGEVGRGEVYRFHPLFHSFLKRRLRAETGGADVEKELGRLAEYYLAAGQPELGLSYLTESRMFERAAEVVSETGREWLETGAIVSLGLLAAGIPEAALKLHPRSMFFKGEAARLQGDAETAAVFLQAAAAALSEAGDGRYEAEALHSLASLARRRGRRTEAFELLARAEKLVPTDSETYLKCANTRGLCLIGELKWAEAEQQFRVALELAERSSNARYARMIMHNLALGPGLRGDFAEALRWFGRIFRGDGPEQPMPQEAIGHLNVGRMRIYRGEFEPAAEHLQKALELCHLFNLRSLLGEVFEAFGNLQRETGDMANAAESYERAGKAYADAGIELSSRELEEEKARLRLVNGDAAGARSELERLIEERRRSGNVIGEYSARSLMARARLELNDIEGLTDELALLITFFRNDQHYYEEAAASLSLAETFFASGTPAQAVQHIQRVLDLSARYEYDFWLRREIARRPDVFGLEDIRERLPADLRKVLESPASATPAHVPPVAACDLTINVLGPVEIYRDATVPFAPDAWTTRRSRDIFCCIATARHRRVSKDVLIDLFWPDDDPAVVEKNFHPTISHIRKALNSRQAFRQNFLLFRDGAYQIDPEASVVIDTEEFERAIAEAETGKREKDKERLAASLERAREIYRGEFMPGVYDDWAEERRAYFNGQYERVLAALAKLALADGKPTRALQLAGDLLRGDPYREDMHRIAMKALAAQGKSSAVKAQFDGLAATLKKDLGIEPSAETRRLYQQLLSKS